MAALPPELVRKILDCLQNDVQALKAVSLLSESWLVAGRERLFHHYILRDTEADPIVSVGGGEELSIALRPYVRRLTINGSRASGVPCNELLSRAYSLDVFSDLTELTVSRVTLPNANSLARVLSSCPRLTSLAVEDVAFLRAVDLDATSRNPHSLPIHLSRLRLQGSGRRDVMVAIFSKPSIATAPHCDSPSRSLPRITRFTISPLTRPEAAVLKTFSPLYLRHLVHLSVAYDIFDPNTVFWCKGGTISGFLELRTLYIGSLIVAGQPLNPTSVILPTVLAGIKMPQLETLMLELAIRRVGQVDSEGGTIDWNAIDGALVRTDLFAHIQSVIFHVTGGADVDGLKSLLVSRLPLVHRRGLLRVQRSLQTIHTLYGHLDEK